MGIGKKGWEKIFDWVAGKKLAELRKQVKKMKLKQCVDYFEEMKKKRSGSWENPEVEVMKLNVFFFFFKFKFFYTYIYFLNFLLIPKLKKKKKEAKTASFQHS